MELKKFSLLLVLLIAFSATVTLSEETVEDDATADATAEGTEETEATDEGDEDPATDEASDDEVKEEDDVLVLTTKTFDSVVKDKDVMLVEFYAPWFVDIYVSCTDTNLVFCCLFTFVILNLESNMLRTDQICFSSLFS